MKIKDVLQEHMENYLCYEIGIEVVRRGAPISVMDTLLDGSTPVLAAPVLELEELTQKWTTEKRQVGIREALRQLGLEAPADMPNPRRLATTACQRWAKREAKILLDEWQKNEDR